MPSTHIANISGFLKSVDVTEMVNSKVDSDGTVQQLWRAYAEAVCDRDIDQNTQRLAVSNDPEVSIRRRYFTSTINRSVFKRLLVKANLSRSPFTIATAAAMLSMTHKAVTTMMKECVELNAAVKVNIPKVAGDVSASNFYQGTDSLANEFLGTCCVVAYEKTENICRARDLFSEYVRFQQKQVTVLQEATPIQVGSRSHRPRV